MSLMTARLVIPEKSALAVLAFTAHEHADPDESANPRSLPLLDPPSLNNLADADAQIFPRVFLFNTGVGDKLAHPIDAQRFADFVDGQAHVGGSERGVDLRSREELRAAPDTWPLIPN